MPALSKKQQKFMGIVRSIQKGEQPASKFNKDAQDVAKDMKKKDVKKFASTKHKGLPMKKEIMGKLKELIKQELSEYTYGSGDIVKDVNPTCPHYGAQGKVKSVNPRSVVFVVMNKGKNFKPGMELEKSHDQMKKIGESINEMSAKSKKIISKLGKKEKEMFSTMVDMLGFDQVMADYKRDKKAFKQALADMSENINEKKKMFPPDKMTPKQAKEYKKFIGYAKMGVEYQIDMSLFESVNEDGHTDVASAKRKAMLMVEYSNKLLNKLNGMNKEDSLPSWLSDKITLASDYLHKATHYLLNPVESVKESMNPSAVKKMRDEFEKTGQLPPHLKKFALDLKILKKKHKVKNIVVPGLEWMSDIKEVNESKELDTIEKIVKSAKNFMDVGSALKKVRIKSDFQTSMGLPRYTFKLNGKRYGILNKKNVSKPDRVVGDIAFGVMESINEGKGVEKVLKMANDQSFGKLGGRTVDALSAGLFKGVYDKASDKNKEKINKMNEKQLYVFMTKLWSKFGNQVRIS